MLRVCKKCGKEYTAWFCPHCRAKRRRRSSSSRAWNVAEARARMLGGWSDADALMGPYVGTVEREPDEDETAKDLLGAVDGAPEDWRRR
jgi:hypothetical protein